MRQEVVFVNASIERPNTAEISSVCQDMMDQGLTLVTTAACEGMNQEGVPGTVGLWLFFVEKDSMVINAAGDRLEVEYASPSRSGMPRRWSTLVADGSRQGFT